MKPESSAARHHHETSDRWERLAALFEGALALPPAERDAYVREHCPDPGIAAEIRALLAAQVAEAGPVERVMAALGSPAGNPWRDAAPRSQVGPYELLREIGHGGMGMVYLARRADGVYQRLVALKLARAPVLDATLRDRFLAERDILAGLAHPNIATLFDGGVTDDGLPYFTMEYVDGRPIDAYCDANRLDLARAHPAVPPHLRGGRRRPSCPRRPPRPEADQRPGHRTAR